MAAVLDAAVQVLAEEGAQRFTTARVAERAGVSVGSLYQYFPNKAAILFRLQSDEWVRTTALMRTILAEEDTPAADRLRTLVHAFIRSECEEAGMRVALNDAAPLYRDAPETKGAKVAGHAVVHAFLHDAAPQMPEPACRQAADLITTTLSEVGRRFSEAPRTVAEVTDYADRVADMLCAYLDALGRR